MTVFDLEKSRAEAQLRLGRASRRRRRSDAGMSRLRPAVLRRFRTLVLGLDRPPVADIRRDLGAWCSKHGERAPSRASIYNTLPRIPTRSYPIASLPPHVREALYNLDPDGEVPGRQLAFYCFNYGSLAAVSYAAGLPWLDLYQASRLRGWRQQTHGLLRAVLRARGIA